MASTNAKLYFDPVSEGICEILGCTQRAKYRASWSEGIIVKLICPPHKADVEGKHFAELSPATFKDKRLAQEAILALDHQ